MMIAIKKILVPTDLSPVSVPAIGYASSLAKDRDAEVVLIHVVSTETMKPHFTGSDGDGLAFPAKMGMNFRRLPDVDKLYNQKKRSMLAFVQDRIEAEVRTGVRIKRVVRLGKVADETVAAAKEEQCDLIVMASEGGRIRNLLGLSNTERIVRQAPCPVLSMQPSAEIRTANDRRVQVKLVDQWAD
jgi:nucleotide-binding universal stress UspA family protein